MRANSDYNLGKLYADLTKQWHPTKNKQLTPYEVTPGVDRKVWWICSRGHEWEASIGNRTRGRGCPECYKENRSEIHRRAAVKRSGSLADKYPDLAKEWHPTKNKKTTPYTVTSGSNIKVWWKCKQEHEWEASVVNRTKGTGCPYCSGKKSSEDYNLVIKYPDLAKEWHPTKNRELTPYDVTPGSGKKVWWICSRGREWEAVRQQWPREQRKVEQ